MKFFITFISLKFNYYVKRNGQKKGRQEKAYQNLEGKKGRKESKEKRLSAFLLEKGRPASMMTGRLF